MGMFTMKADITVRATRTPSWELADDWTWPGEPTDVTGFARALIESSRPSSKNQD